MINTTGRTLPIKEAFARHFLRGIDEAYAATEEMRDWLNRDRATRALLCADRMIDDAEKLLNSYQEKNKGQEKGLHTPLPVILIAFGRDTQPASPDRLRPLPNPEYVQLAEQGETYQWRVDFVEQRVQIAFFAHTAETARAMTSQMRLFFQRYGNNRFPVRWQFGGYEFDLTASIQDLPASDDIADLDGRTNLTVLTWTFTLDYQIPHITAPTPHELTNSGKIRGFKVVTQTGVEVKRV